MAKTKGSNPLLVVAGLGLLAGLYGVFEALVYRTEATGLGSYVPWGLGVALYLLFLGLSAGGLLVNCLVYILAHGIERFLLGSVSSKVVAHAKCDVLTARKH